MRRRNIYRTLAIAIGSGSILAAPARTTASPVTFEVSGILIEVHDRPNEFDGAVSIGDPFFASFTFEGDTVDSYGDQTAGVYDQAIMGLSGRVGPVAFSGPSGYYNEIIIWNDWHQHGDYFHVISSVDVVDVNMEFDLELLDRTGTVFSTDALPLTPPRLGAFDQVLFRLYEEPNYLAFEVQITSLVPEPSTLILLILATVSLGRFKFSGSI